MEILAPISPIILTKKCVRCHKTFQTYDSKKVCCGGRCRKDHPTPRKRNAQGVFTK